MSQDDLALALDICQKTISNWESDKGFPTLEQLSSLETDVLSWFAENGIIFKQHNKNGDNAGFIQKNSEKLLEQYEKRIAEKDQIISEQKEMIRQLLSK